MDDSMKNYTKEKIDLNILNVTVWKLLCDGEHYGYEARPNEGYVMFNPSEKNFDFDPETFEQKEVTHYRQIAGFPKNYNFAKFHYKTELRILVDPKYIF